MWRARVSGRKTKHIGLRSNDVTPSHCSRNTSIAVHKVLF
jgi:hypothetical protein